MSRLFTPCLCSAAVMSLAILTSCGSPEEQTSSPSFSFPINVPLFIRDKGTNRVAERIQDNRVVNGKKDLLGINKRWQIKDAGNGLVRFLNLGNFRCMSADGTFTFAQVRTADCSSNTTFWKIDKTPQGSRITFAMNGAVTGQCLAVSGGNPALGIDFILFPCGEPSAAFFFDLI